MINFSLPKDWNWITLTDVQAASGRAIVSGPFGSNIGSKFFVPFGVPVIRGNNLTTDMTRFIDRGFVFITEEKAKELTNCEALPGDLIFTAAGSLGQVGLIPQDARYPKYIISNKQMRARLDASKVDVFFAFYWLSSPWMVRHIEQQNTGSSVPLINLSILRSLPLPLPPLKEQKVIANILGTLDDKIELNQQMNRNLEAIAQAIFKSWFVDFNPVRAKMEGRQPEGMDTVTAALFPDSFEDSRLGEIPKGWGVKTLGEVLELAYGKALKEDNRRPGDIPVLGSNGQIGWHDEKLVDTPGIVVGRKGNPGTVIWCPTVFFPIDTTFYVVPKDSIQSKYYLLYALRAQDLPSLSADSAVPGLNRNLAYMNHILVPSSKCLSLFDSYIQGVYEKIQANNEQSRTLATIRDTLLPKLMSGEIRVKEAEEILEDVA